MIRPIDLGFCYGPSWAVGVRALNKDEKLIMCIGYICIVNGSLHFFICACFLLAIGYRKNKNDDDGRFIQKGEYFLLDFVTVQGN